MKNTAIITAGGIGRRMGSAIPKQFLPLAGFPVLVHTIRAFLQTNGVDDIVLVVPREHIHETHQLLTAHDLKRCRVVEGGLRRQDSVERGLEAAPNADFLIVHDGVRPMITPDIIEKCLSRAQAHGAAITAIPVLDTIKSVTDDTIQKTVDRSHLWRAQTPQIIERDLLAQAYQKAKADNFQATDEASLLENMGYQTVIVQGSETNIKITRPEDLTIATAFLHEREMKSNYPIKIGHGYDAHRLVEGRALILGGVSIPHAKGLLGHSDADVLTHALCDALLGAAGLGDIGRHFPDSDPQYKGIESLKLLEEVRNLLAQKGLTATNADVTLVAQEPKLAPYLEQMKENLARACHLEKEAINIKATTTEEMGFTGRREGIACHAVVLLQGR